MAKEQRDHKPAKARIFFGYAEVEGGDGSIEESVRSIAAAVVRSVNPTPPPRFVKSLPASPTNPGVRDDKNSEEATLFHQPGNDNGQDHERGEDGEDLPEDGVLDDHEPGSRKERAPKKAPTYAIVKDLNLHPADKPDLKTFYAEKNPSGQQEQLALFVFYLKDVLGIENVGVNHMFTCFREVEKRVPKDIAQIARNTASRKGWVDSSDTNNLRSTVKGQNFVNHDLPRAGSVKSDNQ